MLIIFCLFVCLSIAQIVAPEHGDWYVHQFRGTYVLLVEHGTAASGSWRSSYMLYYIYGRNINSMSTCHSCLNGSVVSGDVFLYKVIKLVRGELDYDYSLMQKQSLIISKEFVHNYIFSYKAKNETAKDKPALNNEANGCKYTLEECTTFPWSYKLFLKEISMLLYTYFINFTNNFAFVRFIRHLKFQSYLFRKIEKGIFCWTYFRSTLQTSILLLTISYYLITLSYFTVEWVYRSVENVLR